MCDLLLSGQGCKSPIAGLGVLQKLEAKAAPGLLASRLAGGSDWMLLMLAGGETAGTNDGP